MEIAHQIGNNTTNIHAHAIHTIFTAFGYHYQLNMHRQHESEKNKQKTIQKLNAENENAICVASHDAIVSVAFDPNKVGRVSSSLNLR